MNEFAKGMKLILISLETPKTPKQLILETSLPARTIRFAVSRLKKLEMIKEVVSLKDARKKFYVRGNDNESK